MTHRASAQKQLKSSRAAFLWLSFLAGLLLSQWSSSSSAQVIRDTTLPESSVVTRTGDTDEITGGTTRGNNLFHSFSQFSVPTGGTAFFNNATSIQNIITRVTGTSTSNVDGLIRANGAANLFILNPNGFVFGPNARLDIGGSFVATTADRLRFADGLEFSASDPASSPLTISTPIGLQYGRNSGRILVQGSGNQAVFGPNDELLRDGRPAGLQVREGQTIALLGGEVVLQGGNLTAENGQIILGSVVGGESILTPTVAGWTVGYAPGTQFGDILLSQAASADVSGSAGGTIQVQGQQIRLTEGSALLATTLGSGTGAGIFVNAQDSLTLTGVSRDAAGTALFQSGLYTNTPEGATGRSGDVVVNAGRLLSVTDGGQITALTHGAGRTGNLTIQAERIELTGVPEGLGPSGFSAQVRGTGSSGSSGNILIQATHFRVADGGFVSSATEGRGNAGNITVRANSIDLLRGARGFGASGLFAQAFEESSGNGGNVQVIGDRLNILDGARIELDTVSSGNAGTLDISVNQINLEGASPGGFPGGLFLESDGGSGNAGTLRINARQLRLANGVEISSSTTGAGDAGNIRINASEIEVLGTENRTGIFAAVNIPEASGNGGNLEINADRLQVLGGAQVVAGTRGTGRAGNLTVNAQTVELAGIDPVSGRSSGLFASALIGTGAGGNVRVEANRLQVRDGATITAGNFPSPGLDIPPGRGSAGSIAINADVIELEGGSITASTNLVGRGNITIQSNFLLLNRNGTIATNSLGSDPGGNIDLDIDYLIVRDNSDITANATNARGGRITISAQSILGTQYREQLTEGSDITATSELGPAFSGTVQINLPELEPDQGLTPAPSTVQPRTQIVAACERLRGNEMVITGRGGLPADAGQLLRGQRLWQDTRILDVPNDVPNNMPNDVPNDVLNDVPSQSPAREPSPQSEVQPSTVQPIVEAQGWIRTADGGIQLFAETPGAEERSQEVAFDTAQCNNLSSQPSNNLSSNL